MCIHCTYSKWIQLIPKDNNVNTNLLSRDLRWRQRSFFSGWPSPCGCRHRAPCRVPAVPAAAATPAGPPACCGSGPVRAVCRPAAAAAAPAAACGAGRPCASTGGWGRCAPAAPPPAVGPAGPSAQNRRRRWSDCGRPAGRAPPARPAAGRPAPAGRWPWCAGWRQTAAAGRPPTAASYTPDSGHGPRTPSSQSRPAVPSHRRPLIVASLQPAPVGRPDHQWARPAGVRRRQPAQTADPPSPASASPRNNQTSGRGPVLRRHRRRQVRRNWSAGRRERWAHGTALAQHQQQQTDRCSQSLALEWPLQAGGPSQKGTPCPPWGDRVGS